MQAMNNLPLVLLMLLAGCTEQTPAPLTEIEDVVSEADPVEVVETEDDQALFKVIKIVDGDTIDVLTDAKETIRLRFNGIDAPERGQPFGNNATKFVSDTVGGKMVRLVVHEKDKYGRTIADVYLPVDDPLVELPDLFLNRELVRCGLPWHYKEYSDDERSHGMKNKPERPNWDSGAIRDTLHRGTGGSYQKKNGTN